MELKLAKNNKPLQARVTKAEFKTEIIIQMA